MYCALQVDICYICRVAFLTRQTIRNDKKSLCTPIKTRIYWTHPFTDCQLFVQSPKTKAFHSVGFYFSMTTGPHCLCSLSLTYSIQQIHAVWYRSVTSINCRAYLTTSHSVSLQAMGSKPIHHNSLHERPSQIIAGFVYKHV